MSRPELWAFVECGVAIEFANHTNPQALSRDSRVREGVVAFNSEETSATELAHTLQLAYFTKLNSTYKDSDTTFSSLLKQQILLILARHYSICYCNDRVHASELKLTEEEQQLWATVNNINASSRCVAEALYKSARLETKGIPTCSPAHYRIRHDILPSKT